MRVFVLCTGRSGSTTLAKSLSHASNVTVGHESRNHLIDGRLDYPDDHIEIDSRLAWFLGPLDERFPDALYVHLRRNPDAVAETYARVWTERVERRRLGWAIRHLRQTRTYWRKWRRDPFSTEPRIMVLAFAYGLVRSPRPFPPDQRARVARLMVDTMESNIRGFLEHRPHWTVSVETFERDVERLWDGLGLEGDKEAALAELLVRHNTTQGPLREDKTDP